MDMFRSKMANFTVKRTELATINLPELAKKQLSLLVEHSGVTASNGY